MTCQNTVEASNRRGSDTSLLAKQLDGYLASVNSLRAAARVCMDVIPSADEVLCNLGTFAFVAFHLLSTGGGDAAAVADILRFIEILEEHQTEVQGMITRPHLTTALLYDVSRRWSLYLNRCIMAFSS